MPVTFASSNVQNLGVHLSGGNDLSRADVRRCGHAVAAMNVGLCGFQEIAEHSDRVDVAAGLGRGYGFITSGNEYSELAIGYRKSDFELVHGSVQEWLLTHGEPHLEPNRYYLRALFKRIGRGNMKPIAFGTVHTVSKAWSGGSEESHRQHLWNAQWMGVGEHEKRDLDAGHTVVGSGDLNRTHKIPLNHRNQRMVGHDGLDWVWVTEGSEVKFETLNVAVKNTPSDHNILAVRAHLSLVT